MANIADFINKMDIFKYMMRDFLYTQFGRNISKLLGENMDQLKKIIINDPEVFFALFGNWAGKF